MGGNIVRFRRDASGEVESLSLSLGGSTTCASTGSTNELPGMATQYASA
jgi:hypothetical protein